MNRQASIGLLAVLAAGTLFYLQPGASRAAGNPDGAKEQAKRRAGTSAQEPESDETRACDDIAQYLELFLDLKPVRRPDSCRAPDFPKSDQNYGSKNAPKETLPLDLRFVIATLPDPIHTHLALMFDRMAEVIQQAVQDEQYSYEASWLPWDDKDQTYALLADKDQAANRKELTENQPGIFLFRRNFQADASTTGGHDPNQSDAKMLAPYRQGLIVFVVGEDPTRGIHMEQFTNALDWIDKLSNGDQPHIAILGPTFSGSFPSLAKLLSGPESRKYLKTYYQKSSQLPIYSGTANSGSGINEFAQEFSDNQQPQSRSEHPKIDFHYFLERDEVALERFCYALRNQGYAADAIAIVSEDETAYGQYSPRNPFPTRGTEKPNVKSQCLNALTLYYPRDISALRAAYQTNALFNTTSAEQASSVTPGRLPSYLADPEGDEHDTIRSYGGNQTTLSQEAYMLGLANAMRTHHIQFVILRSTNVFDQLFLARFLRKAYPDGRIVTDNSDRLFEREGGTTGMGGMMSLSTYPLLDREQEWIDPNTVLPRLFNSDASEGTYIALRMLFHTQALSVDAESVCQLKQLTSQQSQAIAGSLAPITSNCKLGVTVPDYRSPLWMTPAKEKCQGCGDRSESDAFHRPGTWISVIARDGYWPVALLNENTITASDPRKSDGATPPVPKYPFDIPVSVKLVLIFVGAFCFFHFWCCWKASFTAKPAFRAHFANPGKWQHTVLVSLGSLSAAILPLLMGWGYGVFDPAAMPRHRWWVGSVVVGEAVLALAGSAVNIWRLGRLRATNSVEAHMERSRFNASALILLVCAGMALAVGFLFLAIVYPLNHWLTVANRAFAYYRGMHILSGVSPIGPLLAFALAMYIWFWNSLHGLALFGPDRCRLPARDDLKSDDHTGSGTKLDVLCMFSQKLAADPTEAAATPLNRECAMFGSVAFVLLLAIVVTVSQPHIPVRTLGPECFAGVFLVCLIACTSVMLAEAWQLLRTWTRLRALLMFLDRTALRRTLAALRGFSWGTVWGMSGNVLDVRYKLLSRQLESLGHTISALQDQKANDVSAVARAECIEALGSTRDDGMEFAKWYAKNYQDSDAGDLSRLEKFQTSVAKTSAVLLVRLLLPEWRTEENSLILEETVPGQEENEEHHRPPLSQKQYIRDAEEFVCLPYLGFIQNVLGRMRSMVMSILWLFVATALAISSYPFDPRQGLSGTMLALFLLLGFVILSVYAQMHRDATLSHVTNTRPGELGIDFWLKLLSFGIVPVAGLLTTIFPEIGDFVFSWVQPGIQAIK